MGVEELPVDQGPSTAELTALAVVGRVAHNGMTDKCHVHANLMGSASHQFDIEQRGLRESFPNSEMGQRRFPRSQGRHS